LQISRINACPRRRGGGRGSRDQKSREKGLDGGLAGPRLFHFISPVQPHKPTTSPTQSCLLQKRKRYPRSQPNPAQPITASSDPSPTIIRSVRTLDSGRPAIVLTNRCWGTFFHPARNPLLHGSPCSVNPSQPPLKFLQVLFAVSSSHLTGSQRRKVVR
jgi:hypothetical protein